MPPTTGAPFSLLHTPDGVLSMHVDMIDVTDMGNAVPDKKWVYTDEQGHEHFYDGYPDPYPTLIDVPGEMYYCADCRDDHADSHLECRICGEEIHPGMHARSSPFRMQIPGLRHYFLDGEEISQERFTEVLSRYHAQKE